MIKLITKAIDECPSDKFILFCKVVPESMLQDYYQSTDSKRKFVAKGWFKHRFGYFPSSLPSSTHQTSIER